MSSAPTNAAPKGTPTVSCSTRHEGAVLILTITGRLDAFGARQFQEQITGILTQKPAALVCDMGAVDYLSSAGIRGLLILAKAVKGHNGNLAIAGLTPYCREVLAITGMLEHLAVFDHLPEAVAQVSRHQRTNDLETRWGSIPFTTWPEGSARIIPCTDGRGVLKIMGDVRDVLYSRVTPAHIASKPFSQTEYSIGLGALGDKPEDYLPLLGEMMTVGGNMVWLPADGHDAPDYLLPKADGPRVMIRTAFNVSIAGGINDLILFGSSSPAGISITSLYRQLFDWARANRPAFRGAVGLVMRAQLATVYGSGLLKSPLTTAAPANGKMIMHESNVKDWLAMDVEPRLRDVSALICGIGADLTADLSNYDESEFNRVFYLHPGNIGARTELIHNHAVIFADTPMQEAVPNLDQEITALTEHGEFLDMRHLFDKSTVTRAWIGVVYIQTFEQDDKGQHPQPGSLPPASYAPPLPAAMVPQQRAQALKQYSQFK